MVNIAMGILHNRDDAEDAVQETLLETWVYSQNNAINSLAGFLAKATRLRSLRSLYKSKRRQRLAPTVPLQDYTAGEDFILHTSTWTHNDPLLTIEHEFYVAELSSWLRGLFIASRLTEKQRTRLYRWAIEGKTQGQIADEEGVSLNAMHLCISSARAALIKASRANGKELV